jgi:hypothetical protein
VQTQVTASLREGHVLGQGGRNADCSESICVSGKKWETSGFFREVPEREGKGKQLNDMGS